LQFVGAPQGARYVIDRRIAELENTTLRTNPELAPQPGENNFVHTQVHLGAAAQIIAAVEEALNVPDADPNTIIPELQYAGTLVGHTEPHIAAMAEDPTRTREFGEMRQAFQQIVARLQAMMRLAERLTPTEEEQQEQITRLDMKMQEHQLKMQMAQEAHQVKLALRQAEVQQRLQLRQAQTQIKVAGQLSQQAAKA
jgi:hypothetical protein